MARRQIFDTLNIVTVENMGPKISNHVNLTFFFKPTHTVRYPTLRGRKTDTLGLDMRHFWVDRLSDIRHHTVGYLTLHGRIFDTLGGWIFDA